MKTFSAMYELSPAMIETTAMTVITPMITPSSVRKLRSLFVVSAPAAMRRVSMCWLLVESQKRNVEC